MNIVRYAVLLDTPRGHNLVTKYYYDKICREHPGGGTHRRGERAFILEFLKAGQYVIEGGYPCSGSCEERHGPAAVKGWTDNDEMHWLWAGSHPHIRLPVLDVASFLDNTVLPSAS